MLSDRSDAGVCAALNTVNLPSTQKVPCDRASLACARGINAVEAVRHLATKKTLSSAAYTALRRRMSTTVCQPARMAGVHLLDLVAATAQPAQGEGRRGGRNARLGMARPAARQRVHVGVGIRHAARRQSIIHDIAGGCAVGHEHRGGQWAAVGSENATPPPLRRSPFHRCSLGGDDVDAVDGDGMPRDGPA